MQEFNFAEAVELEANPGEEVIINLRNGAVRGRFYANPDTQPEAKQSTDTPR